MALPPPTCAEMRAVYPVLGAMELSAELGYTTAARPQVVLSQSRLSASYLHRTAAHRGYPLGAPHPATRPAPRGTRRRLGRQSWGRPRPRVGPAGEPEHAPAPVTPAAEARPPDAPGPGRG